MKIVIGILLAIIIVFIPYILYLWYKIKKQQQYTRNIEDNISNSLNQENRDLIQKKQELVNQYQLKQRELGQLIDNVQKQNVILTQIQNNTKLLKENAENEADKAYQSRMLELESTYSRKQQELEKEQLLSIEDMNQTKRDLEKDIEAIAIQKLQASAELDNLKAKQRAYIEAKKREQELRQQVDYYRLVISKEDLDDIDLLRDLQKRMTNKTSIDKLIWENYYKLAYNTLLSNVCNKKDKICGIYRITDITTGYCYIGQSIGIQERWKSHIKTSLSYTPATNKLYQAMQQHGPHNFTFEILEEVSRDKLNEREVYWIDFYGTKEAGLNKTIGGS